MFVKKPRSSEAYEGDTVIIMCEVIGDPKPEVVWLRDFLKVRKRNLFICLVLEPEDSLRYMRL
jgi:hypothetical protein